MKKQMTHTELENYLSQMIQCPYSVKTEILDRIKYVNQIDNVPVTYEVETTTDELGKTTIKVAVKEGLIFNVGIREENTYTITIDSTNNKYKVIGEEVLRSKETRGKMILRVIETNIDATKNSWNNQPGFIVTAEERRTYASKKDDANLLLSDSQIEEKSYYDSYGIEQARDSIMKYYQKREDYKFTWGLPKVNMRTPETTYTNRTQRTGISTAEAYINKKDMMGNLIGNEKKYYSLSIEHDLGSMNRLSELSEQQHQNQMIYESGLTSEELDKMLENTSKTTRTGLITIYCSQHNKTR